MVWAEVIALCAFFTLLWVTYRLVTTASAKESFLGPELTALLLFGNLLTAFALIVLAGRAVARRRLKHSPIGSRGRLHGRLVSLFSLVAAVPILLMVAAASLLFQYAVDVWFSDRARIMFQNATSLAEGYYQEKYQSLTNQTVTMASDLRDYLRERPADDPKFSNAYAYQVYYRELSESAIIRLKPGSFPETISAINPDDRPVESRISPALVAQLAKQPVVVSTQGDRIEAVMALVPEADLYLYAARVADPQALLQTKRAAAVMADYEVLSRRARGLQLYFNLGLYGVSVLIVALAVWIALALADRLVRPVGELVDAARRVAGGDFAVRVRSPRRADEVAVLARAFNRMTRRLALQTETLEERRALIEAVLAGVSAGVLSIDSGRIVRIANASASRMLGLPPIQILGLPLSAVVPEFDAMIDEGAPGAIIAVRRNGEEASTFSVHLVADDDGHVLTFDDITQQLADQRRAAWSDVARRIAHEIKNPLTPIQLAAERIQRRYLREITSDPATFTQLTETIVRQVGDLRRMVDEFSSFARLPTPVFKPESLIVIARQILFLHEVGHPAIRFVLVAPDALPAFECDRQQIGQALTNLVKNAVEAIERKERRKLGTDIVSITITQDARGSVCIEVADTGEGLPEDRDRLAEPYVTKSRKGTGLGLAIVKKIVEDHGGRLNLCDRVGGGSMVLIEFDSLQRDVPTQPDVNTREQADPPMPRPDPPSSSQIIMTSGEIPPENEPKRGM